MKAAVMNSFGGPEVLKVVEVPEPKPGPGEVQIKVMGAQVNRFDHYIRLGEIKPDLPLPHILGLDAAGEIAELGEGATKFKIGERVIAMPGYPTAAEECDIRPVTSAASYANRGLELPGSYAQYITIPERWVLPDTTGLLPEQAASLPVPFLTALRAVQIAGEVKRGDSVLIHAGGSATGMMGIQIARALGARVATTVRSDLSYELAQIMGADLIINTSKESFLPAVKEWTGGRGVDVVVDSLGGTQFEQTLDAARTQGIIVAMGFMAGAQVSFNIRSFFFGQKQIRGSLTADIEDFARWMPRIRAGEIKVIVDRVLPLAQAATAHQLVSDNASRGSVVLSPWL